MQFGAGRQTETYLVRIENEVAVLLHREDSEPWVDSLRSWLASDRQPLEVDPILINEGKLLAPVKAPQKIIGVGLNYKQHALEQDKVSPTRPMFFTKSPGAIIGYGQPIAFSPEDSPAVDYEAELAVVIGKTTRRVSAESTLDHVLGYTICNDVTARDAQRDDGQFFRAKSFDTFSPLGPYIVTADEVPDPQSLNIKTWVNDEPRQDGPTSDMIFSVAEVVSYASRFMTLEPGDVITTGTPSGVGVGHTPPVFLQNGDVIKIQIDGIGELVNPVETY